MGIKRILGGIVDNLTHDLTDLDGLGRPGPPEIIKNVIVEASENELKRQDKERRIKSIMDDNQRSREEAIALLENSGKEIVTTFDTDSVTTKTQNTKTKQKNRNTSIKGEKLKRTYRDRGGVLRYPYEALTERTDYLQIDINQYESARKRSGNDKSFIGRVGTRRLSSRGRNPFGLTTKSLVNKGTVLLQIPSQVQDGNSVSYGDSKMNTIIGAALGGSANLVADVADKLTEPGGGGPFERIGAAGQAGKKAFLAAAKDAQVNENNALALFNAKIATSVVGAFGANVSVNQFLARSEGQIFNPNMELLFNGPTLRNFRFSFKMTPRSPEEAEQCKLIIRTFKMNMAPKVTNGRGEQSLFLNTPNVFELRYKSGAANHPFLHRFKQCFLTDISVNYTGEGVYATYENREPVSMIMDLTFKELEPIYDQDYFDDIGRDADSTVGY